MNAGDATFTFLYILFFAVTASYSDQVPVYMWETDRSSDIMPVLEKSNQEAFRNVLQERSDKRSPIVVFAEENLSPEDFILHDVNNTIPFTHLKELKASTHVTYMPFVKNPVTLFREIFSDSVLETSLAEALRNPNIKLDDKNVLIVELDDASEVDSRIEMLKRHDEDVVAVYNKLAKKYKDISGFFTGRHASWVTNEELDRHIRAADNTSTAATKATNTSGEVYQNENVLLYLGSAPVAFYDKKLVTLDKVTLSTLNNETSCLDITLSSTESTETTAELKFKVTQMGYWVLRNIFILDGSQNISLQVKEVTAPLGFSFHCGKYKYTNVNSSHTGLNFSSDFQVQLFKSGNSSAFGDAYDCVGFMSAPIWSGIFVTLILAIILTFGLTMIMDIKTMDRFDDPKGKTITITATE